MGVKNLLQQLRVTLARSKSHSGLPGVKMTYLKGENKIHSSAIISNSTLIGAVNIMENVHLDGVDVIGDVSIDAFSSIEKNTRIYSKINPIKIGKYCSLSWDLDIIEYNHKMHRPSTYYMGSKVFGENESEDIESKGPIVLENDVWVGAKSIILGGARINNGGVLGAGSLLTSEIPAYHIAAGNPAKVIGQRFNDTDIQELLDSVWWEWKEEEILKNKKFFLSKYSSLKQ